MLVANQRAGDGRFNHWEGHFIRGIISYWRKMHRFGSWKVDLYGEIDSFAQSIHPQPPSFPSARTNLQRHKVCLPQALSLQPEGTALLFCSWCCATHQPDSLLATTKTVYFCPGTRN